MASLTRGMRETRIQLCLDCGKCTVSCPVAQFDAAFNPRLIVQRNLGGSPDHGDKSIWQCLGCHMCVERCNYRVDFPEFVRLLKTQATGSGAEAPCTHGGVLQSLMRLMSGPDREQNRLDWLPSDVRLVNESDTSFFTGCAPYFDIVFADLGAKTLDGIAGALRLLNRSGVEFKLLAAERCCGRDLLLNGDEQGFLSLARLNVAEFEKHGVKRIITGCAECFYTLKVDYPRMTGHAIPEVLHLSQVIAGAIEAGRLRLGSLDARATYHDPCMLGRQGRVFDAPRKALGAVKGLSLVEMEARRETALCCGASSWGFCGAVNRLIQGQRLAQAQATGASLLVTACPKCLIHLKCAQRDGAAPAIPIRDFADVLAGSLAEEVPNRSRGVADG